ncbi:hypothetical protein J22TS3_41080 [Paenibacillus sp. J22TS3]|nr:hypothetical protein J22TS3_41080 [Paenibacillus sp. J22TS3]
MNDNVQYDDRGWSFQCFNGYGLEHGEDWADTYGISCTGGTAIAAEARDSYPAAGYQEAF